MEQPEKTGGTGGNTNVSDDPKQRVVEALHRDLYVDSTNITVSTQDNIIVDLHGTVPERAMIKAAEECVRPLSVIDITNDLKIKYSDDKLKNRPRRRPVSGNFSSPCGFLLGRTRIYHQRQKLLLFSGSLHK